MKRLHDVGIDVTVFTSGWTMKGRQLPRSRRGLERGGEDGRADAIIHGAIRGRAGAFDEA